MSRNCHIDLETFSRTLLTKAGVYRYAEDVSTEILIACYAFDDGPVNVWIPDADIPRELYIRILKYVRDTQPGGLGLVSVCFKTPLPLRWHAENKGFFVAHNAQFERTILNGKPGKMLGFPLTKRSQWICTAAKAAEHGLPRDLARCAKALGTEHQKDENGKGDMLRLSKPRKPSKLNPCKRWLPDDVPDKFYNLYTYCINDVLTERDIDNTVKPLTKNEVKVYQLDQKINDRGWRVDVEGLKDVQSLIEGYKERLVEKMQKLCGLRPSQTQALAEWIRGQDVELENLQAQTVKDVIKRKDLPKEVKWVLRIYSLHNMKAPAKFTAMQRAMCEDESLRGMFRFYGASTGRWSSQIVQLQNLFRPVIDDPEFAIELFSKREIELIKMWYDKNPMKVFASCVRGMLIAREGRDLLFADYSAIEARIVAWLASQMDMLKIFATHGLAYEYTAAKIYNHSLDIEFLKTMKKDHEFKRFLGKIAVLALGYQGGRAAFVKMSEQFGAKISGEQAEQIKWDWRESNPQIVDMWEDVQDAARNAIESPGEIFKANRLMFRVQGDYLYMRVPSGRKLAYYKPQIKNEEIRYMGIDTYTRQYTLCKTYGGKLVQNAAEAIARDLMVNGMLKLNSLKGKYPIIGTVHDEIITEPKENSGSVEEVCQIMCDKPSWAEGLPIRAVGDRTKRYRK